MEFTISRTEMNRRKRAYLTMVGFMVVGLFLFFKLFSLPMLPIVWVPFITVFFLLGVISFSSLHELARMKINVTDQEIICVRGSTMNRYPLKDIQSVRTKRRSTGAIRAIYFLFQNHKHLSINGFEDGFDQLEKTIIDKVNPTISTTEVREPIDFDHPLFYPIFGTIMSLCFVIVIKAAVFVN
jgi:hypothetical protein